MNRRMQRTRSVLGVGGQSELPIGLLGVPQQRGGTTSLMRARSQTACDVIFFPSATWHQPRSGIIRVQKFDYAVVGINVSFSAESSV